MVAFVVAVMITCFHAHGLLQKAITGAGWVLIAMLVMGVAITYVLEKDFSPNVSGSDEKVRHGSPNDPVHVEVQDVFHPWRQRRTADCESQFSLTATMDEGDSG